MTIDQMLQRALQHHQAGELAQAEPLYRQILQQQPNHADALCLLGVLATQAGHPAAALDLLRRADQLVPGSAQVRLAQTEAHARLGDQQQSRGDHAAAIASYRAALALKDDFPEIWNNLGMSLALSGHHEQAVAAYRQALAIRPAFAEVHNNLADALRLLRRYDESLAAANEAIRLRPTYAHAHNNLGTTLLELGRVNEAIDVFRTVLRFDPAMADTHNNLGNALAAVGRYEEALAAYQSAIAARPDFPEALNNLANTLREASQVDPAIDALQKALQLRPELAETHNNYANALRDIGRPAEAVQSFRTAVRLKPDFQIAWSNLLYTTWFDPTCDAVALVAEHRRWAQQFADPLTASAAPHVIDRDPGRRLRIGYVSPDFRDHPAGSFLLPLLGHHDRERFEIICYSDVVRNDHVTQRLRQHADQWHETTHLHDDAVAQRIRADRIDVLVDLAVHSAGNRLLAFARKPAPVQATYLGYPGTTGIAAMDWRLTDRLLDPPDQPPRGFTERPMYLDTTYWCYSAPEQAPPVAQRDGSQPITFGCMNALVKVSDAALATWSTLLDRVAGSRLILHCPPGRHRERIAAIVGSDRVKFVGRCLLPEYFGHYHAIDIALDPFPYNGATTTCDALWMGVPVVSLAGDIAVRRAGLSILSRVGLADLVAQNVEGYIEVAVTLAADQPRRDELRSSLRDRMSRCALMDAAGFVRDVERAYREMWRQA